MRSADEPGDLQVGAFTSEPPWLVDPERMPWRSGIDALRTRTRARVPHLIAPRRLPPARVATVGVRLSRALVPWAIRERKDRGDPEALGRLAAPLRAASAR